MRFPRTVRHTTRAGTAISAALLSLAACADGPTAPDAPPGAARASAVAPGHPGDVVFHSRRQGGPAEVWLMKADGSAPVQLIDSPDPAVNAHPHWSTNGRYIAFMSTRSGDADLFVMAADGSEQTNLTNHPAADQAPAWSPNGQQIAFHTDRDGNFEIYVLDLRSGDVTRLTDHAGADQFPDWSPDGQRIAFTRDGDIHVLDLRSGDVTQLTFAPQLDDTPAWSTNGRQIAFQSFRDGYSAIYLMNADGTDAVSLTPKPADVSNAFLWWSQWPSWTRDGKQILFQGTRPETAGNVEIFIMNADGSEQTRLTTAPGVDGRPGAR